MNRLAFVRNVLSATATAAAAAAEEGEQGSAAEAQVETKQEIGHTLSSGLAGNGGCATSAAEAYGTLAPPCGRPSDDGRRRALQQHSACYSALAADDAVSHIELCRVAACDGET